jgi:amidase
MPSIASRPKVRALSDPFDAFCPHGTVVLSGAPVGPLAGLSFAAKDLFDIARDVTGAGNPDWLASHPAAAKTAPVVQKLVDAGATMVGKTHTDELSRGLFGENVHYGTPVNPKAPDCVPGGSSSGSAAAVAGGAVHFALGTDTGGSVRVPASFCGLYGIRPTHGRLAFDGVLPQAPSFDTIGWLATDATLLAQIAAVLFGSRTHPAPRPTRLLIAQDAFGLSEPATVAALAPAVERLAGLVGRVETQPFSRVPLSEWRGHQSALQSREAWLTFANWIEQTNPRLSFEVAAAFVRGASVPDDALEAADRFRRERRAEIGALLADGTVVCLPTTPFPAPRCGEPRSCMASLRARILMLTCIAGMLGCPQISLPLAELDGRPIGLSILAAPGSDAMLLALACAVASMP